MSEQPDPGLAAEVAALRAERDELAARALEAETLAEDLADELADARRRLAALEAPGPRDLTDPTDPTDPTDLTVMDGAAPAASGGSLAPDGSDRGVLPIALGALAVVALLIALTTVVTGGFTFLSFVFLVAAGCFAWAALSTRVATTSAEIVDGVVTVVEGDSTRTFDLRNDQVRIDVQGKPGDPYWRVRFYRRSLDPVDVDVDMTDPAEFMARLREFRPDA